LDAVYYIQTKKGEFSMGYQKIVNNVSVRIQDRIMDVVVKLDVEVIYEDGQEFAVPEINVRISPPTECDLLQELYDELEHFAIQAENRDDFLYRKEIDMVFDLFDNEFCELKFLD
jgi:hypothetical protein